jgi:hypothetical protein
MPRHGEITVELPPLPVFRQISGRMSAVPRVFIHLRDMESDQLVRHEISYAVAKHINLKAVDKALDDVGWADIYTAASQPAQSNQIGV